MSYSDYRNNIEHSIIYLAEIELITCTRTFGVAPCTATGTKCYNTSTTCKDKPHFNKASNITKFCSADIQDIPDGYRPYIKSVTFVPAEIKDDKTVPQLINMTLCDEPDSDIATDPYWSERGTIDGRGTYFKKLFARNSNLKGRILTLKQGFAGLPLNDYQTVAVCKISEYKDENGTISIKANDLLKSLDEYKYPFRNAGQNVGFDIAKSFEVNGENGMLSLDAIKGDRCRRQDFGEVYGLTITTQAGGSLVPGKTYSYKIYTYFGSYPMGYKYYDVAISILNPTHGTIKIEFNDTMTPGDTLVLCDSYRIYGRDAGAIKYKTGGFTSHKATITDDGSDLYTNTGEKPDYYPKYKEYILNSNNPKDINSWGWTLTPETITLTNNAGLESSGYVKIDDEIIYYDSYELLNGDAVLQGVRRGLFGTTSERHKAGTPVYIIVNYAPANPYTIAKDLLSRGGVESAFIDTGAFNILESAWSGIKFSCPPITKETDLGKLYFDLINVLDCASWVNEAGKITIKKYGAPVVTHAITDESSIINKSGKVTGGTSDVKTRLSLYWDKFDATKSETDKEGYRRLTTSIDADAESVNEYDDEIEKIIYSTWINSDCGTIDALNAYVNTLLGKKLDRLRDPRTSYTFDAELKDSDIILGEVIYLDSDEINQASGANLDGHYEIVKREPKGNRITFTARFYPETSRSYTYTSERVVDVAPKINTTQKMPAEIAALNLEFYNGVTYQGGNNLSAKLGKNEITLRWTNGYTRTDADIHDIYGNELTLSDTTSHKLTASYNIYICPLNKNASPKKSEYEYPNANDSRGKWKKLANVPDRKITDDTYKYTYTIKNLKVGVYYDFYVSEVMRLDKNAVVDEEVS